METIEPNISLNVATLSIHSSPVGKLGTRDTGGMSVYISELSKALGNMGHHIDIFTLDQNRENGARVQLYHNVRLYHLKIDTGVKITKETLNDHLPQVFRAFNGIVSDGGLEYDLIHSHYWLSGVLGIKIQKMWNLPHVITFHTTGAAKNRACPMENEPGTRIENEIKLNRRCNCIISSTRHEKENLKNLYYGDEKKIATVPPGVNFELFKPKDKARARKRLGYMNEERVILFVGRYVPVKGLDRLLAAVACLKNQSRFRILVVGGDSSGSPGDNKLSKNIKNIKFKGSVDMIGRVNQAQLPTYYNAADLLAVSSYHESFGLAALESLSCGTPVVGTSVGDLPHIINDKNGCVLKIFHPKAFAEAMEKVIRNARQGHLTQEYIRNSVREYTWKNTATQVLNEYKKVLSGQSFVRPL